MISYYSTRLESSAGKIGKEWKMFERQQFRKKYSGLGFLFEKGLSPEEKERIKITISFLFIMLSVSLFAVYYSVQRGFLAWRATIFPPPYIISRWEKKEKEQGRDEVNVVDLSFKQNELNKLEWFLCWQLKRGSSAPYTIKYWFFFKPRGLCCSKTSCWCWL